MAGEIERGRAWTARPPRRLRLLDEAERLRAPAVASELLQLDAVSGRRAWEIEALATVPCHQLVRAVGERDRLPLLVASAGPAPELDRDAVAVGARAARDVEHHALGIAADDAVVAAVRWDEPPLLVVLAAATRPLLDRSAIPCPPIARVHALARGPVHQGVPRRREINAAVIAATSPGPGVLR